MRVRAAALFLAILGTPLIVLAQTSGSISGLVTDESSGALLATIPVRLVPPGGTIRGTVNAAAPLGGAFDTVTVTAFSGGRAVASINTSPGTLYTLGELPPGRALGGYSLIRA